jgi:hypothetical protein
MATISRANLYHVPGKKWREWTPQARGVFNLVYSTMRPNQSLFIHPKAAKHSREHWNTVAWNAAWTAANAADGDVITGDMMLEGRPDADGVLHQSDAVVVGVIQPDQPSPVTS